MTSTRQYNDNLKQPNRNIMFGLMGTIYDFVTMMLLQYFDTRTLYLLNAVNKEYRAIALKIIGDTMNNKKHKLNENNMHHFFFALDIEIFVCLSAPFDHPMCPINIHNLLKKIRPLRLKIILIPLEDLLNSEYENIYLVDKLENYFEERQKLVNERHTRVMLDATKDSHDGTLTDMSTLMNPKIDVLAKCHFERKLDDEKIAERNGVMNNIKSTINTDTMYRTINKILMTQRTTTPTDIAYVFGGMLDALIHLPYIIDTEDERFVKCVNDPSVMMCCNASNYLKQIKWLFVPSSVVHFEILNRVAKKTTSSSNHPRFVDNLPIDDTPVFNINILMRKISESCNNEARERNGVRDTYNNMSIRFVDLIISDTFFPQIKNTGDTILNPKEHENNDCDRGHIGEHGIHIGEKRPILYPLMFFVNCFALTSSNKNNNTEKTLTFLPLISDNRIKSFLCIPTYSRESENVGNVTMYFEFNKNHSILIIENGKKHNVNENKIDDDNNNCENIPDQKIMNVSAVRDTAIALSELYYPEPPNQTVGQAIEIRNKLNILYDINAIVSDNELSPDYTMTTEIKEFYNKYVAFAESVSIIEKRIIEASKPTLNIVAKKSCPKYVEWVLAMVSLMSRPKVIKTVNFTMDFVSNTHIIDDGDANIRKLLEEEYYIRKKHCLNILKKNLRFAFSFTISCGSTSIHDRLKYYFPLKINSGSIHSYINKSYINKNKSNELTTNQMFLNLEHIVRGAYVPF